MLAVFSATQVESRGQLLLHAPSGCGHFKILATSLDIYLVMGYGYPNMEFRVLEVISFHFIKGMLNKDFLHFFIIWHQIWWFFKNEHFITKSAAVEFWKIIQYDQKLSLQHISPWWFQNIKSDVWVHTRILKIHHYY